MSPRTLVLGLAALLLVRVTPAAAIPPADANCRKGIDAGAVAVSGAVFKNEEKCFRLRMIGAIPGTVNWTDTAAPAFPDALSVGKAKTKAAQSVLRGCLGAQTPQTNGYVFCPAPCDAAVPTIAAYGDVADCIACLADRRTSDAIGAAYGNPGSPAGDAAKCQNQIGKAVQKYAITQQKESQACQFTEDLTPTGANCRLADPRSKVARALLKINLIAEKCGAPTNEWSVLNSCGGSASAEQSCIKAEADMLDDDLFDDVYNPIGFDGVFVSSTTGSSGGSGTTSSPLDTIGGGIARAIVGAKSNVFVDGGAYAEAINLATGINVLGGFNSSLGWQRDGSTTSVFSPSASAGVGSFGSNVAVGLRAAHAASEVGLGASGYGDRRDVSSNGT